MRLTQWTDYSLRVLMYCAASEGRPIEQIDLPRNRWYETVTEPINPLREVERYSLAEVLGQAQALHDKARSEILLQRGGLLLISILLTWHH